MTSRTQRWTLLAVTALALATAGWTLAGAPGPAQMPQEMMEMMKKMMMERPKALKNADATVGKEKAKLIEAGKYTCCLKHPCDYCALKMGGCPCGMNAQKDMPVCNECKGSWYAGDGAVPGKTADQIKTLPRPPMPM
jgi:hypothetical protein